MTRLGAKQRQRLAYLGQPSLFQIVGCDIARSLANRGLLKAFGDDNDSFYAITPNGLRALADELETGRIAQHLGKAAVP